MLGFLWTLPSTLAPPAVVTLGSSTPSDTVGTLTVGLNKSPLAPWITGWLGGLRGIWCGFTEL